MSSEYVVVGRTTGLSGSKSIVILLIMGKKYIHYGHKCFDPKLFRKPRNRHGFSKPSGGFWASPVDAEFGWKDWCDRNDFRKCCIDCSFTFTLKDDAKVLTIRYTGDAKRLPQRPLDCWPSDWVMPDFEKLIRDGWDAVELVLSSDEWLYWVMYGWDCDSIVILNPDVIVEVKE